MNSSQINRRFENSAKILIAVIMFFVLLLSLSVYTLIKSPYVEEMCSKKAQKTVGDNWTKPIPVTKKDILEIPFLSTAINDDKTVFWGVKEALLCERDYKFFYFF